MSYIKLIADGKEIKLFCGYLSGMQFTSTGVINYATSRPVIKYLGDKLSDKVNLFETTSLAFIDANGVQRSLPITNRPVSYTIGRNSSVIKKTTGLFWGNVTAIDINIKQANNMLLLYQLDPYFEDFQPILGLISKPMSNTKITPSTTGVYADTMYFNTDGGMIIGMTPTNLSNTWNPRIEKNSDEVVPVSEYPFYMCKGKWRYLTQNKQLYTPNTYQPTNMTTVLEYTRSVYPKSVVILVG